MNILRIHSKQWPPKTPVCFLYIFRSDTELKPRTYNCTANNIWTRTSDPALFRMQRGCPGYSMRRRPSLQYDTIFVPRASGSFGLLFVGALGTRVVGRRLTVTPLIKPPPSYYSHYIFGPKKSTCSHLIM